jgi:POT family proton-dependent oligopeptide transporter
MILAENINYMSSAKTLPEFLGHPKGLFYLFFVELWERFSFYGMKALLIMYMTEQLMYSDEASFGIFAAYGSLVYATPLIGGILAEKVIGYRKSIILGAILMAIGHITMSVETPIFFYGSLAIIVVGNGFFKPNISSLVGALYRDNEIKKEAGFTIFYLGINLGGMIAPLLCAWLGLTYGWHFGFGLAGVGMLVGLICFYKGVNDEVFGAEGLMPEQTPVKTILGLDKEHLILFLSFASVPIFAFLIYFHEYEHILVLALTLVIAVVIVKILVKVSAIERTRLIALVYFTVLATLFWAIFEQAGSSITLFASRNVDLTWLNASQTNSINAAFIILLAIPFSFLWAFLSKIKHNPNTPIKFAIGLILLGCGFLVFASSAQLANNVAKTPMSFLIFGYFVYTVGEMFLSPIGLSKVTELSPVKYTAFIMGIWFLSSFYGHFFAGKIAKLTAFVILFRVYVPFTLANKLEKEN